MAYRKRFVSRSPRRSASPVEWGGAIYRASNQGVEAGESVWIPISAAEDLNPFIDPTIMRIRGDVYMTTDLQGTTRATAVFGIMVASDADGQGNLPPFTTLSEYLTWPWLYFKYFSFKGGSNSNQEPQYHMIDTKGMRKIPTGSAIWAYTAAFGPVQQSPVFFDFMVRYVLKSS